MTGYIDEYPLIVCTIIKLKFLVFQPYKIFKFNVPSIDIEIKDPHFHTRTDATNLDSYTEHVSKTALLHVIDRMSVNYW
jgi:hypothetical protein